MGNQIVLSKDFLFAIETGILAPKLGSKEVFTNSFLPRKVLENTSFKSREGTWVCLPILAFEINKTMPAVRQNYAGT